MGHKVVRLFDSYDKYFFGAKGDDGKGLIIDDYIDDDFEDLGIGLGWQLQKLGKRNVMKTSFIMLKNQLMAQASTAKKFGYELTFIDISIKQSSSTPNSPAITYNQTNNIPQTAPLNPIPAPNIAVQPQLQQAQDPFTQMPEINIADIKQKEDNDAKQKMDRERKNSLPTSAEKPKHRPKLSQEQIKRFKPPTKKVLTQQTSISQPNTMQSSKSAPTEPILTEPISTEPIST